VEKPILLTNYVVTGLGSRDEHVYFETVDQAKKYIVENNCMYPEIYRITRIESKKESALELLKQLHQELWQRDYYSPDAQEMLHEVIAMLEGK
jgi:hypothetical protein